MFGLTPNRITMVILENDNFNISKLCDIHAQYQNCKESLDFLVAHNVNCYIPTIWQMYNPGLSQAGGLGGLWADQLTLSRPGGAHYPHPVLLAPPPDFQTLRHAWEELSLFWDEDKISFEGLLDLKSMSKLKILNLERFKINDEAPEYLKHQLPHLTTLRFGGLEIIRSPLPFRR